MKTRIKHTRSWVNQYIIDSIFALTILFLPFAIYVHLIFDPEATGINLLGYQFDHEFKSNQVLAWSLISNIVGLLFLFLLYLSSQGIWRYFLFIVVFDIFSTILFTFSSGHDYLEFLFSAPNILGNIGIFSLFWICESKYERERVNKLNLIPTKLILRELCSSWAHKFNLHTNEVIVKKTGFTLKAYLHRVYYLTQVLEKKYDLNNSEGLRYNLFEQGRRTQVVLSGFIIITSIFIYLDNFIPAGVESLRIGNIEIGKFGFQDVTTFFWYASRKLSLCFLGVMWFITSANWWRWAILSPIIFYAYQFWESFQPISEIDGEGNIKVFPLVFITILGVLLLSKIIRRISVNLDYQTLLREELNQGLEELSRPDYKIR